MTEYNKLVRDNIPEIMTVKGEKPIIRILSDAEYRKMLDLKLEEEVSEYLENGEIEELCDIIEVIFAISESKQITVKQLFEIYRKKHNERGGFGKKIFLIGKE